MIYLDIMRDGVWTGPMGTGSIKASTTHQDPQGLQWQT